MVNASLVADLLAKLEEEKDQWIYNAMERFDGQKVEKNQVLGTAEDQMMQIKNIVHRMCRQKKLDLEVMETEIKKLEENIDENQRTLENLKPSLDVLQKELALYEAGAKGLDMIQLEKYLCVVEDKFTFDKKDQVVFKERKISKLLEIYEMVETEMVDFYQNQLSNIWLLLTRSMQNISSNAKFDFETNHPIMDVSLKHGRGLDQYLKLGNFEEDYWIVVDTLEGNNGHVYDYYLNQILQFQRNAKEEIKQLSESKKKQKRLADEKVQELQDSNREMKERLLELQDKSGIVKKDWKQDSLQPKRLDDILKEEFVRTVSGLREKLFAEDTSDLERWAYYQYSQIILKQGERIIGNEYF